MRTSSTSAPVSRYAHESPTLATSNSQPTTAAIVAVVPDTCGAGSALSGRRV